MAISTTGSHLMLSIVVCQKVHFSSMNNMSYMCCCVFGLVATVRAFIYFPLGMQSALTKKKIEKKRERQNIRLKKKKENYRGERMKVQQFLMNLKCIRQSRRQHKGKSIFYSQTINFNEQDHKDGGSPLQMVHEVKSTFPT